MPPVERRSARRVQARADPGPRSARASKTGSGGGGDDSQHDEQERITPCALAAAAAAGLLAALFAVAVQRGLGYGRLTFPVTATHGDGTTSTAHQSTAARGAHDSSLAHDWHGPGSGTSQLLLARCDIPTVAWTTPYTSPTHERGNGGGGGQQPFRVTLDRTNAQEWSHDTRWRREEVLERFGNLTVWARGVGSAVRAQFGHAALPLPVGVQHQGAPSRGEDPLALSLRSFANMLRSGTADDKQRMVFDVAASSEATARMQDAWPRWPSYFPTNTTTDPTHHDLLGRARPALSIGGNGTGLAFHAHGAAWLATLAGTKLWFIVDPMHWPVAAQVRHCSTRMHTNHWRPHSAMQVMQMLSVIASCCACLPRLKWNPRLFTSSFLTLSCTTKFVLVCFVPTHRAKARVSWSFMR